MLKPLLSLFLTLWVLGASAQAVVYVDAAASGAGDGSSWADAYTDLQMAIDSSDAGSSLWLAAGTYVAADSSFTIMKELGLYGGFAGTETSADAADPETNVTVLSGDAMGNDGVTYDSTLADDNNRVLMVMDIALTSSFTVTIDGFTITNGAVADDFNGGNLLPFAGAGIYAEARLAVSRVTFTQNRSTFGAAVALIFSNSNGSTFDDVVTRGNYGVSNATYYLRFADSISFTNSLFDGETDTTSTNMIYMEDGNGLFVDNCEFIDIIAPNSAGSAIRTAQTLNVSITNSNFENLLANLGGAIYLRNDSAFMENRAVNPEEVVIDNCTFTDVSSQQWGGAAFFADISHTVRNSSFTDGIGAQTAGLGGALYAQNDDLQLYAYRVDSCEFSGNAAPGSSGGAIFYFTDNVDVEITNSQFSGNSAGANAGAIYLRGAAAERNSESLIDNCEFTSNSTGGFGGAVLLLFENTTVSNSSFSGTEATNGTLYLGAAGKTYRVINTEFTDNGTASSSAMARGAGIWAGLDGGTLPDSVVVDSCTFSGNVTSGDDFISGGSAIYISGEAGMVPSFHIMNSSFFNNAATNEAFSAIEVVNGADLVIENSDFFGNSSDEAGGAINMWQLPVTDSLDGVEFLTYPNGNLPTLTVERSLFVNNISGNQGGAINLFSSSIDMRNSVLLGNAVDLGEGSGGAIIINGSNVIGAELDNYLINNTFYNNRDGGRMEMDTIPGSVGNAVALYQPGNTEADTNSLTLTIQNNAFFMDAATEESIGLELNVGDINDPDGFGELNIVSLGGNYFSSELSDALTFEASAGEDIVNSAVDLETVFEDPFEDDFDSEYPNVSLVNSGDNPLVDAGTTGDLVPEVDFLNNERDDTPDIGALELGSDLTGLAAEPIQNSGLSMEFFPNPTVDVLNIVNNDAAVSSFTVLVTDIQGRYVAGRQFSGVNNKLNVATLPRGVYNLTLLINGKAYSQQLMKQ